MLMLLTIGAVLACAVVFGQWVPLVRLYGAFQPLTVALSIVVAAIFVRLGRGMPTLDWKSMDLGSRTRLTSAIVALTREYAIITAINVALLAIIVVLTVLGKDEVQATWPPTIQREVSFLVGGSICLCVCRMAYVVWRDLDIVRLQKHLIDASASREAADNEVRTAANKIADIRAAGLRKVANRDPPSWD
jgi:hypothetical protein